MKTEISWKRRATTICDDVDAVVPPVGDSGVFIVHRKSGILYIPAESVEFIQTFYEKEQS